MRSTQYRQESLLNITELPFQERRPSYAPQPVSFVINILLLAVLLILTSCTTFPLNSTQTNDAECVLSSTISKQISDGWLFRLDPNDVGLLDDWKNGATDKNEWVSLTPGKPWEASGFDYNGVAWYTTKITLPDWPETYLGFGKVDDSATLWINGDQVENWANLGPETTLVDLGKYGKADDKLHLSIRIVDKGGYGGIK